ncbi:hypothetical protein [Aminobacter ciceronei]|uniref:Uncharacterized protein n=1 Tax=Aminobacter ciceronei TaxID=150723 RepID=A0ABR6C6E8_9HYPH|nr:hypothetical protein [Aminobacter ciceronei]MBA8906808.1 hypothetical protein [Aminobacter ciceronei]MBA9020587.1 hypothetical protein [Aminobacter ciceronei]
MAYRWFELEDGRSVYRKEETRRPKRSTLACPMIAQDTMEPVQSMLDGKMYDSKSKLLSTYRAAGMIEVGNDPARLRTRKRPKPDRAAIKTTVEKAKARFDRGERVRPR